MKIKDKYSDQNAANRVRPPLSFVYSHPAHCISLFFGIGSVKKAAGTWATLLGLIVWFFLERVLPFEALLALVAFAWLIGAWASEETSIALGVHDANCIVIDEVAAIWTVLILVPMTPIAWLAGFCFFRLFDILKIPPAGYFDQRMQNGWGIMLDDAVAAIWSIVAMLVLDKILSMFGISFMGLM